MSEKAKQFGIQISAATIGAVVAVLVMLGLVGPDKDKAAQQTENRLTKLESHVPALEKTMENGFAEVKQSIRDLRADLKLSGAR